MGVAIYGKEVAISYKEKLKNFMVHRVENGLRPPCIASILIGKDKGSLFYIKNQSKLCEEVGVEFKSIILEENVPEGSVLETIDKLNIDDNIDGIILQLPLPEYLNEEKIINRINHLKDVDGLTDVNAGKFYKGESVFFHVQLKG